MAQYTEKDLSPQRNPRSLPHLGTQYSSLAVAEPATYSQPPPPPWSLAGSWLVPSAFFWLDLARFPPGYVPWEHASPTSPGAGSGFSLWAWPAFCRCLSQSGRRACACAQCGSWRSMCWTHCEVHFPRHQAGRLLCCSPRLSTQGRRCGTSSHRVPLASQVDGSASIPSRASLEAGSAAR